MSNTYLFYSLNLKAVDRILTKVYHGRKIQINKMIKYTMKEEACYLNVTRAEVQKYLDEVKASIELGNYMISSRTKNQSLYVDYVFSETRCKDILLDLEVDDFSDAVQNDHPQHPEEILYIFGKDVLLLPKQGGGEEAVALYIKCNMLADQYVIVISLHKQEYPLKYKFK